MKYRFKRFVHSDKESNFDLVDHFSDEDLKFCAYEVELVYEYDSETKDLQLIGAEGKFLSDEAITSEELTGIKPQE